MCSRGKESSSLPHCPELRGRDTVECPRHIIQQETWGWTCWTCSSSDTHSDPVGGCRSPSRHGQLGFWELTAAVPNLWWLGRPHRKGHSNQCVNMSPSTKPGRPFQSHLPKEVFSYHPISITQVPHLTLSHDALHAPLWTLRISHSSWRNVTVDAFWAVTGT